MQQDQWHYKDDRLGTRVGPIDLEEAGRLIAAEKIKRSTLVWNPAMPDWQKASTTDLSNLFGDTPPPFPPGEIRRWAIYALALLPLWGLLIQALTCAAFSDRLGLSPSAMFDQRGWLLFYVACYGVLGDLDERNLHKGGLKIRNAAIMAAILVPVYLFAGCRTINRQAGRSAWLAYLPIVIWVAALATTFFINPLIFDPDAPLFFRPDAWL